jgi:predicted amidohydrolase YtcJ
MMTKAAAIYEQATILTMQPGALHAEAMAVDATGRVMAVGTSEDIAVLAGPGTHRQSLHGAFVMPGLIESHTHALWGACRDLFDAYVGYTASTDQLAGAVRTRAAELPAGTWITGGPWRLDMRADLGMTPRDWLDQIAPAHPVALTDTTQHAMWANSAALDAAGIGPQSPDIPGGVIERDSDGTPTGMLAEAGCAALRRLTAWTPQQLSQACDYASRYLNQLGYTAFKEPMADEATLAAYADAVDTGRMNLHVAAHITAYSPLTEAVVSPDVVARLRTQYARPELRLDYAKLFLDGVAPAYTASFLAPYLPKAGYDPATHDPDSTLLLCPRQINETVTALDALGFCVKMHAVGDNAVRKGLDAIAAARAANGTGGPRHEIAHSTFVDDADLPRFAALDAIAEVSPKLWMPNAGTAAQGAVLGAARLGQVHRIKSMLAAGAEVIFGTDWPAAAPDANPWTGLAGMITRTDPTGRYPGAVAPDEAISLEAALPLFTVNGARAMGMAGQIGTLTPGAWADFIVLDRDIRAITANEIAATKVRQTFFKGVIVHDT